MRRWWRLRVLRRLQRRLERLEARLAAPGPSHTHRVLLAKRNLLRARAELHRAILYPRLITVASRPEQDRHG